jgi:hypothetical protein
MTQPPPPRTISIHLATLAAAVLIILGLMIAGTILATVGSRGAADIVAILGALATTGAALLIALDKVAKLGDQQHTQTETLARIDERTNGELDGRIKAAVSAALDAKVPALVLVPTDLPPAPQPSDTPPTVPAVADPLAA